MSTRCTIHIKEDGKILTSIYIHCDGNPDGVGLDTARALLSIKHYNYMGCLAAHLVSRLKDPDQSGHVYIFPPGQENGDLEYIYTLFIGKKSRKLKLRCKTASGEHVFVGTPEQWVKKYEEETQTNTLPVMGAGTTLTVGGFFESTCF